ncbi:MAG TPA: type I secretion system permease/ATPase [Burkholderiales bacterium]|nr:type I secretion system permease/ATPase [Burkholderiales bacterium]
MRELFSRFRPFFAYAGLFSLAINVLLLVPPLYMLQVFDRVLASRSGETLAMLTIAAVVALLVMALLDVLRARLLATAGAALDRRLGPRVLDGLLSQTARLTGAGYLNGLRDVNTLRSFLGGAGLITLFDAPWLPFFLLVIFLFHPVLGAVALAGALAMVLLAFLNERLTRQPIERAQAQARRAARFIDANVRNAEVVSALGMLPAVTRRWCGLNDSALGEQARAASVGGLFLGATKFTRQFIQLAMLAAGAYLVVAQDVTAGVMIAATILLGRALAPVETLVAGWRGMVEARGAWRRLAELLKNSAPAEPTTELPVPRGLLEVERAVFGFKEKPILRGVSCRLEPGEALGLIGPSASGKSTLARLIVGVWKPLAGAVRLDGADVAAWPRERLGPHIGYLPQDVELFGGTVAENIARLGEPDDAQVVRAAQRAHVHELILRLPKGYDTEIGEAGQALSPGQRQRIALARALYGNPRLVVLDEPNANLDHEGEEALVRTLQILKADGATVVIIAHRPWLLRGVDKMLVLREGLVERFGASSEIMARFARQAA